MDARLIFDVPASGAWNMAVDEALLEGAAARGEPVLRFYAWSAPTLSLGYFQAAGARATHLPSGPCAWVRRSTGGGAILHDREWTYSFTQPAATRSGEETHRLYAAFHETLVDVLQACDVKAELHVPLAAPQSPEDPFLCFLRLTAGDVTLQGAKICGSAQRRSRGGVLQHGSVLWQRSSYAPELPGIEELVKCPLPAAEIQVQWRQRLGERLGLRWRPGTLTDGERFRAEQLVAERFGTGTWNERR